MKFDRQIFFDQIKPTIEVKGVGLLDVQVRGLNQLLDFIEADGRWDEMNPLVAIWTISYFLATVALECTIKMKVGGKNIYVKSFHPVEEMGGTGYLNRMYDTRVDLGNTRERDGDGARNAGDGYVQNTGGSNARKTGKRLKGVEISYSDVQSSDNRVVAAFTREGGSQRTAIKVDEGTFIREHELLRVPHISYLDSVDGMLTGRYTGRDIDDYINEDFLKLNSEGKDKALFNARRVINGINKKNQHVPVEIREMAKKFFKVLGNAKLEGGAPEIQPEPTPVPVEAAVLPSESQSQSGEAGNNSVKAFIPHIDTAKTWFKWLIGGQVSANLYANYAGLSSEIRIGLLVVFGITLLSLVYVFVKYHKQIFDLVTSAMKANADPNQANVELLAHK